MWSGVSSQQYMQLSPPEHGISTSDTQFLYRHARTCHCPPEPVVAADLAWALTGRFCGAAHYSQGWNCHNSPFQLVKRGAEGQEAWCIFTSWNTTSNALPRPPVNICVPFVLFCYLFRLLYTKGIEWAFRLCSIVLCGCEMCDKSSPVQQSIPMTMIIKDALKQRTPYLLYTPSISGTWLWFGNCQPFCVCSALFFVWACLCALTPALASNLTRKKGDS